MRSASWIASSFFSSVEGGGGGASADEEQCAVRLAVHGSFATNVSLFVLKLVAAVLSGSIAVVASCDG